MIATLRQSQSSSFSGYDEDIAKSWAKIQSCKMFAHTCQRTRLIAYSVFDRSLRNECSKTGFQRRKGVVWRRIWPEYDCEHQHVRTSALPFAKELHRGKGRYLQVDLRGHRSFDRRHADLEQFVCGLFEPGDWCRSVSNFAGCRIGSKTDHHRCLPRTCETYIVKHGDTCHSIRKTQQLTLGKLASFNPTFNKSCTNLIIGDSICMSPPGGYAELRGVQSKPKATSIGTVNKRSIDSTETAKGSPAVSPADKLIPSPTPSGVTDQCTRYALSKSNGSCATFAKENGISAAQLYAWNSVFGIHGETCNKFEAGMHYCTGVSGPMRAPGPFQRGVVDTCVRYAKSTHADALGDKCVAFALRNRVALADLYAWKTILKSECLRFLPGEYYCVAVAGP